MTIQTRRAFTVPEVAGMTGLNVQTLYREIRENRVRAIKFGGRLVVPAGELDRLLSLPDSDTSTAVVQ